MFVGEQRMPCLLLALSGHSTDRVARSASGLKADMTHQRLEWPLMTQFVVQAGAKPLVNGSLRDAPFQPVSSHK
jgi:hypothetical protein